jgi:hypothetical protein
MAGLGIVDLDMQLDFFGRIDRMLFKRGFVWKRAGFTWRDWMDGRPGNVG